MSPRNTSHKPTFVSLFSGCGGFDIGFSKAGYKSLGSFDIDSTALGNLRLNTKTNVYKCDLSNGRLQIDFNESPDVVLSGSPCQGFSTIGKRDFNDPRNKLLLSGANIALSLKPKVFIAENVPGVISGSHKQYWNNLHKLMKKEGYHTKELKVDAHDFGVHQKRKRMLFFAWKGHSNFNSLPQIKGGTLENALNNLDDLENHNIDLLEPLSTEFKIASHIKQGQKLSNVRGGNRSVHTWDIPEVFGDITKEEENLLCDIISLRRRHRVRDFGDADPVQRTKLETIYDQKIITTLLRKKYLKETKAGIDIVGGFNGKYRRLSLDQPSYTVDTRFGIAKNFLHPTENRGFTVREAARIQGFPDDYVFSGKVSEQYRMIGNAVPPPMSFHIAQHIKSNFLGNSNV